MGLAEIHDTSYLYLRIAQPIDKIKTLEVCLLEDTNVVGAVLWK
jgi:hypothetical protein